MDNDRETNDDMEIESDDDGSASDSRILDNAIHRVGEGMLVVPEGKFYLVDAGFANQNGFLRPFRNVRYHLKEWRNSNLSSADKELFILRHSSLRNCIERTFSLLKRRFKILNNQPEYPFKTQVKIVNACVLLHNHILTQNTVEEEEAFFEAEEEEESTSKSASAAVETDVEYEDDDNDVGGVGNVDWDQF
ncbi:uncharacterized protein LOC122665749 [Telopea speciosissima]|uniref:uncharacterized protein LOC122665749 n=1 Tax=Telopea speciosissima TaxID=54955 RepID=UPI001CC42174|nr:uncharacterized protein LOC122665749 [Telopea speciosissima]